MLGAEVERYNRVGDLAGECGRGSSGGSGFGGHQSAELPEAVGVGES